MKNMSIKSNVDIPIRDITVKKMGNKILSSILSGIMVSTSIIGLFSSTVTPISAEEITATSSGNTSGHNINTIRTSKCDGGQQLSGTDAEVFKNVVPDSDGDIVCAKSDGFRTEITGTGDIKNYHWTAWYKKNKDDDIDKTLDVGNYRGFNKTKVEQWSNYQNEIKGLSDGKYPASQDYTYPTDTKEPKLDFWADIAGYYSLLGDPQYKGIHLTSYQEFSYKTRHVEQTRELVKDGNSLKNNDDSDITEENYVGPKYTGTGEDSELTTKKKGPREDKSTNSNIKWDEYAWLHYVFQLQDWVYDTTIKATTSSKNKTWNKIGNGIKKYKDFFYNNSFNKWFRSNTDVAIRDGKTIWRWGDEKNGKIIDSASERNYIGRENVDDLTFDVFEDITYSYETQEVKIAEADVANGTYASELGAIPTLALKPGSGSSSTIKASTKKGFWKTTPRYWTDKGEIALQNQTSLPYHFEIDEVGGNGLNNINLYAALTNKSQNESSNSVTTDKTYTIIHGFPNITDTIIQGVDGTPGYPKNQDETCVEVGEDAVCSKKQTPIVNFEVDLKNDSVQQLEEADKNIHLVKNQEVQNNKK